MSITEALDPHPQKLHQLNIFNTEEAELPAELTASIEPCEHRHDRVVIVIRDGKDYCLLCPSFRAAEAKRILTLLQERRIDLSLNAEGLPVYSDEINKVIENVIAAGLMLGGAA